MSENRTLAKEREDRSRSMGKKYKKKQERVSRRNATQEDLESLDFTLSQPKPEMGKEVGRRRAHSLDDRAK